VKQRFLGWFVTVKAFGADCSEDDVTGLAAELSFRAFLALFPFLLFLVTLSAFVASWSGVDDPASKVLNVFGDRLPPDAASVLRTQVEEVVRGRNVGLLSFSIAAAIWTAAGTAGTLMKAVNRVMDLPETRPFWEKTLLSIALVVVGSVSVIGSVAVLVVTEAFMDDFARAIGVGTVFGFIVGLIRLPLLAILVALVTQAIYWLAPNTWHRPRLISPGALSFSLGWAIFTFGFAFYVTHMASYNATYGAMAGVVIMLVWFYVSALLLLVGAELNEFVQARKTAPVTPRAMELAIADARGGAIPHPR
jgi:membrane protein